MSEEPYYKENGGKQSAYNLGLDKAKGELFLCIDSDDILANSMIDTIKDDYEQIKNKPEIGGLMYLQGYINDKNKIIGTNFPKDEMIETYHDMYYKYKITGDKLIVLKTKVAREYYFPIIENEKFVAEALIYNRISLKYKFLCLNKVGAYKEYLEGGYSNNYFSLVKRNPIGNALYFKELYDFEKTFYNVYGYILFSIYGKKSFLEIIRNHKAKFKILVLYIPTLIISKLK